jgi:phosphatidylserine/phosphatidylglycerophosphate/cardiolipin synthase-like enzyme
MFRLLCRAPKATLTNTALYNEQSFYNAFVRDVRRAQSTVVIESPFLTEKRALYFARLFNKLARKGVKVRVNTCNPRHRKLAIIDQQILWEGSLNILSQVLSKEIMRRTNSVELACQMASFTKIHNRFW